MKRVLIIGATSAIAQAVARQLALQGDHLFLVARNAQRLQATAADLGIRGARIAGSLAKDLDHLDDHEQLIDLAEQALGAIDAVLIAHGVLPDQDACARSPYAATQAIHTNFVTYASLLTVLANRLERQHHGVLVVLSSVAGDRGRASNYVYGSTKGALSIFMAGLGDRLSKAGVAVVTVKPGMIASPMTQNFKKGLLWATPEAIAPAIAKALSRAQSATLYLPWFWRPIMLVLQLIPGWLFRRLNL